VLRRAAVVCDGRSRVAASRGRRDGRVVAAARAPLLRDSGCLLPGCRPFPPLSPRTPLSPPFPLFFVPPAVPGGRRGRGGGREGGRGVSPSAAAAPSGAPRRRRHPWRFWRPASCRPPLTRASRSRPSSRVHGVFKGHSCGIRVFHRSAAATGRRLYRPCSAVKDTTQRSAGAPLRSSLTACARAVPPRLFAAAVAAGVRF